MPAFSKSFCAFLIIALTMAAPSPAAQPVDQNDALKQIAAQTSALGHIATIYRLSEDLAFWQGVALMGEKFDWDFSYNTEGTEILRYTIRLSNVSDDGEIEAKRASLAISRNRFLTDDEKQGIGQLYSKYTEMLTIAREMHPLLTNKRVSDAASLFETRTLELRRNISRATYSVSSGIRKKIGSTARKARRKKK